MWIIRHCRRGNRPDGTCALSFTQRLIAAAAPIFVLVAVSGCGGSQAVSSSATTPPATTAPGPPPPIHTTTAPTPRAPTRLTTDLTNLVTEMGSDDMTVALGDAGAESGDCVLTDSMVTASISVLTDAVNVNPGCSPPGGAWATPDQPFVPDQGQKPPCTLIYTKQWRVAVDIWPVTPHGDPSAARTTCNTLIHRFGLEAYSGN
jgi:hypothetical protein